VSSINVAVKAPESKRGTDEAIRTLKTILEKYPGYKDAEMLLREIQGRK
jgi:hypothetical protein